MRAAFARDPRTLVRATPDVDIPGLLRRLEERLGAATALVRPPSIDDSDAPLHALLQAAAHLGRTTVLAALKDAVDVRTRAMELARELTAQDRILLLELPSSWQPREVTGEPGVQLRHHRAEELLGGWLAALKRIIIVADPASIELIRRVDGAPASWQPIDLTPPRADPAALEEESLWGTYAPHARTLAKVLHSRPQLSPTPLQIRLAVALIALNEPVPSVTRRLESPPVHTAHALESQLGDVLKRPASREILAGVVRFLQARWPLPRDFARQIAQLPDEHAPLITVCIGHEVNGAIETAASVQTRLRHLQTRPRLQPRDTFRGLSSVHIELADHHEKLDGARSPADASRSIVHWLEKAYQLGRGGLDATARWSALDLPARELYWHRARSLSIEHHAYTEAAELYKECIQRFDSRDSYSWHYLGFNLDRAGKHRKESEQAFRKAVELRPDHPWYNGRLVTFLIEQARFRDLAREAHRWVVKAWLRFGEVSRARDVFDDIPEAAFDNQPWFQDLRQDLVDAEEALQLGESVYPPEWPMDERWKVPDLASARDARGRPLRAWFPGRVVAVDDQGVHVALAVPHEQPRQRRLIARTLSADEWKRYGFCPAAESVGRYILLVIYDDPEIAEGIIQIFPVPHHDRPPHEADVRHATRYLEWWHLETLA